MNKKRKSTDELLKKAFKLMYQWGELHHKQVNVPLATGGTLRKFIYKVTPLPDKETEHVKLI